MQVRRCIKEKEIKVTLRHIYLEVKQTQEKIMSALSNLNDAVTALNGKVTDVQAAIAALKAVPNNDTEVQAAADNINAAIVTLNSAIQ